ncbi:MAG: peptide chain release factor N(5)-glutamine methyltransferase [Chloroflexota bacterium]
MKIEDAWEYGRIHLHRSPTPDLDARLLLENVLNVSHAYLLTHHNQHLTPTQLEDYKANLARAEKQEPIPYILGTAAFFDFDLTVTPDVLIPRPETEELVELILQWIKQHQRYRLVDVGTGSGCIPIAIARKCELCEITAVDISPQALTVAKRNANRLSPERIDFLHGSLLENFEEKVDVIVANLPYVTDEEWTQLDDGVKLHEPALALIGGRDGLTLIQKLLQQAQRRLNPNGAIFLEIGWQQGTAVSELSQTCFTNAVITVHKDYANHDRFVSIQLKD